MAKDPAFLFYPNDYLGGTMGFTMEQHGMYLTLLIYQFNNGSFSYDVANSICQGSFDKIKHKFTFENDTFFNKRLMDEINKRKSYSDSRRENIKKRYEKSTHVEHMNNTCTTHVLHSGDVCSDYVVHMENENEDENRDEVKDENKKQKVVSVDVEEIIDDLNTTCGTSYRKSVPKTVELIKSRMNEGFTKEDFFTVHKNMFASWGNNQEMRQYLRPQTLYSNKFESYLNKIMSSELDKFSDAGKHTIMVGMDWLKSRKMAGV